MPSSLPAIKTSVGAIPPSPENGAVVPLPAIKGASSPGSPLRPGSSAPNYRGAHRFLVNRKRVVTPPSQKRRLLQEQEESEEERRLRTADAEERERLDKERATLKAKNESRGPEATAAIAIEQEAEEVEPAASSEVPAAVDESTGPVFFNDGQPLSRLPSSSDASDGAVSNNFTSGNLGIFDDDEASLEGSTDVSVEGNAADFDERYAPMPNSPSNEENVVEEAKEEAKQGENEEEADSFGFSSMLPAPRSAKKMLTPLQHKDSMRLYGFRTKRDMEDEDDEPKPPPLLTFNEDEEEEEGDAGAAPTQSPANDEVIGVYEEDEEEAGTEMNAAKRHEMANEEVARKRAELAAVEAAAASADAASPGEEEGSGHFFDDVDPDDAAKAATKLQALKRRQLAKVEVAKKKAELAAAELMAAEETEDAAAEEAGVFFEDVSAEEGNGAAAKLQSLRRGQKARAEVAAKRAAMVAAEAAAEAEEAMSAAFFDDVNPEDAAKAATKLQALKRRQLAQVEVANKKAAAAAAELASAEASEAAATAAVDAAEPIVFDDVSPEEGEKAAVQLQALQRRQMAKLEVAEKRKAKAAADLAAAEITEAELRTEDAAAAQASSSGGEVFFEDVSAEEGNGAATKLQSLRRRQAARAEVAAKRAAMAEAEAAATAAENEAEVFFADVDAQEAASAAAKLQAMQRGNKARGEVEAKKKKEKAKVSFSETTPAEPAAEPADIAAPASAAVAVESDGFGPVPSGFPGAEDDDGQSLGSEISVEEGELDFEARYSIADTFDSQVAPPDTSSSSGAAGGEPSTAAAVLPLPDEPLLSVTSPKVTSPQDKVDFPPSALPEAKSEAPPPAAAAPSQRLSVFSAAMDDQVEEWEKPKEARAYAKSTESGDNGDDARSYGSSVDGADAPKLSMKMGLDEEVAAKPMLGRQLTYSEADIGEEPRSGQSGSEVSSSFMPMDSVNEGGDAKDGSREGDASASEQSESNLGEATEEARAVPPEPPATEVAAAPEPVKVEEQPSVETGAAADPTLDLTARLSTPPTTVTLPADAAAATAVANDEDTFPMSPQTTAKLRAYEAELAAQADAAAKAEAEALELRKRASAQELTIEALTQARDLKEQLDKTSLERENLKKTAAEQAETIEALMAEIRSLRTRSP